MDALDMFNYAVEVLNDFVIYVQMKWNQTNRFLRALFLVLVFELQIYPTRKLGFRCNDSSLSYPFYGDTISWKWLLAVCSLSPLLVMLTVENLCQDKEKAKKRSLRWFKEYMFGYLVNLAFVQFLKTMMGCPRPHFFQTCQPKEALTCKDSEFVFKYTCTKTNSNWLYQSDRSFPSGHTSLAVHAALFIIYYLHRRVPNAASSILVKIVQTFTLCVALWCGVSRVSDRRHHKGDVLVGALIGSCVLVYTTHTLCNKFKCRSDPPTNDEDEIPLE